MYEQNRTIMLVKVLSEDTGGAENTHGAHTDADLDIQSDAHDGAESESESPAAAVGSASLSRISLGKHPDLLAILEQFNIAPDGSPLTQGLLFGPGFVISMPSEEESPIVMELPTEVIEMDTAWPVLMRLCAVLGWRMMDPASGRTFG